MSQNKLKLVKEKDLVIGKTYYDVDDLGWAVKMVFVGVEDGWTLFESKNPKCYTGRPQDGLLDFGYFPDRDWYEE